MTDDKFLADRIGVIMQRAYSISPAERAHIVLCVSVHDELVAIAEAVAQGRSQVKHDETIERTARTILSKVSHGR